ncbi:GNAT family N-acetyltransferase [Acidobacteria bacterium AH-259-A15]|nr:GNAT family N-acetyltransferase [Acidobacteria bacterium AH-259-A15]
MSVEKKFRYILDEDTELLLLKEEDVEELYALTNRNREHLRYWLPWVDSIQSISDTKRYITSSVRQFADDNGFQAGIWFQGRLVGIIGYHGVDWVNRSTTIGYWVGDSFQGKGLVTKACRALVDWAFREWRLNRVEIRCARENHRSRAIPERLGFTEEGIIREGEWLYDHFVDLMLYGMVAKDWRRISSKLKITG